MATLHIQHVGAICDTGCIQLTPIILLLGAQGAGKSTIMKILSYCRWVEKEVMREDGKLKEYSGYGRFIKGLKAFHRLGDTFFNKDSQIIYEGDAITIRWIGSTSGSPMKSNAKITRHNDFSKLRHNPKISFIPAERTLVSAVTDIDKSYKTNTRDSLFNLVLELGEAKKNYRREHSLLLAIAPHLSFFSEDGEDFIVDSKAKKTFPIFYAASGIQSAYPIQLLASYLLSQIGEMPDISVSELALLRIALFAAVKQGQEEDAKEWRKSIQAMRRQLQYSSAQLFIKEPEQNLFPEAQRLLMLNLLHWITSSLDQERQLRDASPRSLLMFTTHSPYLLTVINALMTLCRTRENLNQDTTLPEKERAERLGKLSVIAAQYKINLPLTPQDFSAYFITDEGTLISLIEDDFAMVSGVDLDHVSDWAEELTDKIYTAAYV